jgi:hypothetical protein
MPKVKMSDVKSGSENVKTLFKRIVGDRTLTWLKKQKYSNDELLEILDISENIERHKDKRKLYQDLIESQVGPFNQEVFIKYTNKVYHVEALMNLIRNSFGITVEDKEKWIVVSMVTSSYWFTPYFFMNGECEKYGINIYKTPFNKIFASSAVKSTGTRTELKFSPSSKERNFLWSVLDSMNDEEKMQWYIDDIARTYESKAVDILTSYPNTTPEILTDYYNRTPKQKGEIASHPNAPQEIKNEMYALTKDEKYLPEIVKDIFWFNFVNLKPI